MVLSLVLVGSTASFEVMDERIEEHYEETSTDIGRSDLDHFNVTTTVCTANCDPTPTTTTTTTTTVAPTTTAAPTTTTLPPTTTTTAKPPTTTTLPPTTTTAKPPTTTTAKPTGQPASSEFDDQSRSNKNGATAKVKIWIRDDDGKGLRGAAVTVTMRTSSGATESFTYTIGNNAGHSTLTWAGRKTTDFPVTVTIDSVTLGGTTYQPEQTTFVLRL